MGTELISIKEKLSDITKKAIRDKEFAVDEEEFHSAEEEPEPDIDLDEIVDEIIEFVYMAAAEGKYEFEVGSYAQETNNIRHPKNPDEGTCTPADFCGALYKNRPATSNVVEPMPPVCKGPGARVNYYKATTQNMMPYYNNNNIQY